MLKICVPAYDVVAFGAEHEQAQKLYTLLLMDCIICLFSSAFISAAVRAHHHISALLSEKRSLPFSTTNFMGNVFQSTRVRMAYIFPNLKQCLVLYTYKFDGTVNQRVILHA
jgi:hypothetical protein